MTEAIALVVIIGLSVTMIGLFGYAFWLLMVAERLLAAIVCMAIVFVLCIPWGISACALDDQCVNIVAR